MNGFGRILQKAQAQASSRMAVVCPHDRDTVLAVLHAVNENLVDPILVGNPQLIARAVDDLADVQRFTVIAEPDPERAAAAAVRLVHYGEADVLMKGLLDTSHFLKPILDADEGLRTGRILSHVALFAIPGFERLILMSDAAMNIAPDLEQKQQIVLNAVDVAHGIGVPDPMVAMLCAKEKPTEKMPATMDAVALRDRNRRGDLVGCVVSGPLALDNAVCPEAAAVKKVDDPVAGRADILIVPTIEAGNILYKSVVFLLKAENAGIVAGATAPIVLTSRADSQKAKLNSIATAVALGAR